MLILLETSPRTRYYRAKMSEPKLQEQIVRPIKAMIEEKPSFGYCTVTRLQDVNKNLVQRVLQLIDLKVRKSTLGLSPGIQALTSVAKTSDERWATNLCQI